MNSIREIFKQNVKALRGERQLKEVATGAGIPYRTYQNIEEGVIPQDETLKLLASYFEVSESRLFFDESLTESKASLKDLLALLASLDEDEIAFEVEQLRRYTESPKYKSPKSPQRQRKLK